MKDIKRKITNETEFYLQLLGENLRVKIALFLSVSGQIVKEEVRAKILINDCL